MKATRHTRPSLRPGRSVAILLVLLWACGASVFSASRPDSIRDERGGRVDLRRVLGESKATVFVFVRTDCPISNRYAPELVRLHRAYSSQGVRFYLVYVDPTQAAQSVREHRDTYFPPFEALVDPKHELTTLTGAEITPEAAVFDSAGTLLYRGRIDDRYVDFGKSRPQPTRRDLAVALDETLAGHPVTVPRTKAIGCFIDDLQ